VIVLGRLAPVKRVDLAIGAFLKLQGELPEQAKPHLFIVGTGPLQKELQASIPSDRKTDIEFLGFRDDATSLLAAADVLLLTSDSEGIPTTLLEAASIGVPAVCTEVGGIPEIAAALPEYPLLLCKPGNIDDINAKLLQALRGEFPAGDPILAGRQFAERFSPQVIARKHQTLYTELLQQAQLSGPPAANGRP
jgi:glycosyltransferase involved in cell wall biosynthesis